MGSKCHQPISPNHAAFQSTSITSPLLNTPGRASIRGHQVCDTFLASFPFLFLTKRPWKRCDGVPGAELASVALVSLIPMLIFTGTPHSTLVLTTRTGLYVDIRISMEKQDVGGCLRVGFCWGELHDRR
jgi:hypothetical protein